MEKIPTLFERDWDGDRSRVLDRPNPNADVQWVLDGEGVVTRKYDGTCVMFDGTEWWARREVKEGKTAPPGFKPISHDHVTLAAVGWQPIADSPFAKFHAEALMAHDIDWPLGTYELCGPKINGNPERYAGHVLIRHDAAEQTHLGPNPHDPDRSFSTCAQALAGLGWEGFVFHSTDKGMVKIKARDFGIRRS